MCAFVQLRSSGDTSALDFEDDLKSVLVEAPEGCSFTAKIIAGMFGLLLLVFGAAIIIAALTGYFDSHCSKSACQNSSPCIELENSYTCSCLAGFSGKTRPKVLPSSCVIASVAAYSHEREFCGFRRVL